MTNEKKDYGIAYKKIMKEGGVIIKKIIKLVSIIFLIIIINHIHITNAFTTDNQVIYTNAEEIRISSAFVLVEGNSVGPIGQGNNIDNKDIVTFNPAKIKRREEKNNKGINSISIPGVCNEAELHIGSTQEAVNQYDICIMTEAASIFGQGKPILMGGHNTKSLKFLYRSEINNVIDIRYEEIDYQYQIVYSGECTNNGQQLYDVKTGINMLDYSLNQEVLYIYTCYGDNNWLVKAIRDV